ncbi:hypothetical protein TWF132_008176 [Orbilia oligospora]|nr:hypothetical protein TWF132_008176 [Orbilia oligospora]
MSIKSSWDRQLFLPFSAPTILLPSHNLPIYITALQLSSLFSSSRELEENHLTFSSAKTLKHPLSSKLVRL